MKTWKVSNEVAWTTTGRRHRGHFGLIAISTEMDDTTLFILVDAKRACEKAQQSYDAISGLLASSLPPTAEMHHVGATAIPGCLTKGDLDIVVRVPAEHFADVDLMLASKFIRNNDSIRTVAFSAFENPSSDPHLGIQLTTIGGPFDFFHHFAQALRSSPRLLEEYNSLKLMFHGLDSSLYRAAKGEFIERVIADF